MTSLARLLATAAMLAAAPLTAQAQDFTADPTYETVALESGFTPDPYTVSLSAGGSIDASTLSEDCAGYIASAPDVRLTYEAGSLPLYISALSEGDTTLVVNGPDEQWYCNDDGHSGLNPMVWLSAPESGQYDIWVGNFDDSSLIDATLQISEINSSDTAGGTAVDSPSNAIDFGAEPTYETVSLTSGFTPDPYTVALSSGGPNDAAILGSPCVGYISGVPDVRLNYEAGSLPLYIRTIGEGDTTLVVNGPDGQWHCDDDSAGNADAQVRFEAPMSGQYDIFVGTYNGNTLYPATLQISELASSE